MSEYPNDYFQNFKPNRIFIKLAGVDVTMVMEMSKGIAVLELSAGHYSVFR